MKSPFFRRAMAMALMMIAAPALAQTEPPRAGRPANFSHLAGRFSLSAQAEPTRLILEDPILVHVVITGDLQGEFPPKASLQLFPDDIADAFYIEPVDEKDRLDATARRWEFVWRLRPKATDVREI